MGTQLFFAEDPDPPKSENIFERTAEKLFKLVATTEKQINMKRIFVVPKTEDKNDEEETEDPNKLTQKVVVLERTYQEALELLLKPGQVAPRTVVDSLDNKIRLQRELQAECMTDMDRFMAGVDD